MSGQFGCNLGAMTYPQYGNIQLFKALIMLKLLAKKSEKNIERFSNKVSKTSILGLLGSKFGPNQGPFGPNEEFHSTLIQSAYHALTFNEEIRNNIERFSNKVENVKFGHARACLGPIWAHFDANVGPTPEIDQNG